MPGSKKKKLVPGDYVVLFKIPPGLLQGLPKEDKKAISKIVGKPVLLVKYDGDGRAELKFTCDEGVIHFVYVAPQFIKAAG
ncbi:MAG TPA: hypothetical protein VLV89_08595 [Candidatus Acidoferrum sp.]|nr:hypothetical protein [Candidatus Acidoferrum sp.]